MLEVIVIAKMRSGQREFEPDPVPAAIQFGKMSPRSAMTKCDKAWLLA